ncbi:hypothetical protein BOTBODRAFT_35729 [Botryobasidium botryosum FD-172 SS1]|uniref:Uncharacterized protein n=1 Tax=Botryobasidium botryosum (strain FD-172 SS1) TaxID=930990 RepID=A0A067MHD3_BOTB1|nr:hypothetical protein BOTBODRAFT_35729 [Botryobasidium botryosum FD-172 SS1]
MPEYVPLPTKAALAESRARTPIWKRVLVILFFAVLVALAYLIRSAGPPEPEIIYADRYSKEHKYRPAASPIITETLKDGRIRIRGDYIRTARTREEL